jgi:ABC-type amino acid transport substrate-binding protein
LFVTSKTGDLKGSDISLVRDMARELGVQVEFVRKTHSFDEIIDIVSRGEADIGLATSLTLSRAKKVLFTHPYLTLKIGLLLNRLKLIEHGITSELKELAELRHTTQPIGVLTGSAYAVYARNHFPQATVKEYPSLRELRTAVEKGEVLAAIRNDLTAKLYLHRHPEAILRLQLFVDQSTKDHVAFPVRRDSPHLLAWLNSYLLIKDVHWNASDLVEQYKRLKYAE